MKTEQMTITPQMAEQFLHQNTNNRPVRPFVVNDYAKDMRNGNFPLMPHGIVFADDGTLLDGQHRLLAVVKSGVSCQFMVTTNADKNTSLYQDRGAKRSLSDVLSMNGNDWANIEAVSIIGLVVEQKNKEKLNAFEMEYIANNNESLVKSLRFSQSLFVTKVKFLTTSAVISAVLLANYNGVSEQELTTFASILISGFGSGGRDNSIIALRNHILKNSAEYGRGADGRERLLRLIQQGILNFTKNKDAKRVIIPTGLVWPKIKKQGILP